MHISELEYDLPAELIAQEPARPRDASRLLVLHRAAGEIQHRTFRELPDLLSRGDLVVCNDTRVIRARLRGRREPGGGRAEVLLLERRADGLWEALATPGRRLPPGRRLVFGDGELRGEIVARTPGGTRLLRLTAAGEEAAAIQRLGEVPAPPYIRQPIEQESDYQTVYARAPGASAAPTAGLHFTPEVLARVRTRAALASLTLHVGLGTFRPVRSEIVEEHDIHEEWYEVPEQTAQLVSAALAEGRRIVAIGTSTARALESAWQEGGGLRAGAARTDLFILPGYRFRAVKALLTNFHAPRSTLLALICALADRELVMQAYREAVERRYRFLSFGDAMFIT